MKCPDGVNCSGGDGNGNNNMTVSNGFWRPSFRHGKQSSFNEILVENCDGSTSNGKQQQTTLMKGQC